MNSNMTALGTSGVGGDWPASTAGSTSARTIRARRGMRSPKIPALRPDDRTRIDSPPRPQVHRDVNHDHQRREHPLGCARETVRVNNRDQVVRDEATAVAGATRSQRERVFQGRKRTDETW